MTTNSKPTLDQINTFLAQRSVAVAGVSRDQKKFGHVIFKELLKAGYDAFALNPNIDTIDGHKCYRAPAELPSQVSALVLVTPPAQTLKLLEQAVEKGLRYFWIQQGAENTEVLAFCRQNQLHAISGRCILMHLEPVKSIHKVHRFFSKLFGLYPK